MEEKKKSKGGLLLILLLLLIIIGVLIWYFLIRKPEEKDNKGNETNTQETKTKIEYDYRDGVLTPAKDENGNNIQSDFVINGIILIGNRHEYVDRDDTTEIIAYFAEKGYKKEGINSSFYLGEWIEFYIDTPYTGPTANLDVLVVPHKEIAEYQKMQKNDVAHIAEEKGFVLDYSSPDPDNYKYVGNGYINQDNSEGKYDILFYYKQELVYFIELSLTKE